MTVQAQRRRDLLGRHRAKAQDRGHGRYLAQFEAGILQHADSLVLPDESVATTDVDDDEYYIGALTVDEQQRGRA